MALGLLEFAVDEVIAGEVVEAEPGLLYVEFLVGDERLMPRYTRRVPRERVMLFLHNKGLDAEAEDRDPNGPLAGFDYYVISNATSFFVESNGRVEVSIGAERRWLKDLNGADFDSLRTDVRAIVSAG